MASIASFWLGPHPKSHHIGASNVRTPSRRQLSLLFWYLAFRRYRDMSRYRDESLQGQALSLSSEANPNPLFDLRLNALLATHSQKLFFTQQELT